MHTLAMVPERSQTCVETIQLLFSYEHEPTAHEYTIQHIRDVPSFNSFCDGKEEEEAKMRIITKYNG